MGNGAGVPKQPVSKRWRFVHGLSRSGAIVPDGRPKRNGASAHVRYGAFVPDEAIRNGPPAPYVKWCIGDSAVMSASSTTLALSNFHSIYAYLPMTLSIPPFPYPPHSCHSPIHQRQVTQRNGIILPDTVIVGRSVRERFINTTQTVRELAFNTRMFTLLIRPISLLYQYQLNLSAPEGAVLVLPNGASSRTDLTSSIRPLLLAHARQHDLGWLEWVYGLVFSILEGSLLVSIFLRRPTAFSTSRLIIFRHKR
jgi:hypothetical protein